MPTRSSTPPSGKATDEETERRVRPRRAESGEAGAEPPVEAGGGDGDEPTEAAGEWLFKQNDMVLGPVTARVLIDKIKQGELALDTLVARDGEPFKEMKLVGFFRDAHEDYVERKRLEEEERAYAAAVRKAGILRALIVACAVFIPSASGAVAGRVVMVMRPWDDTPAWVDRAPLIVDLAARPPPLPKIALVTPHADAAPDAGVEGAGAGAEGAGEEPRPDRTDRADRRKGDRRGEAPSGAVAAASAPAAAGAPAAEAGPPPPSDGDKGFVKELTNEQAIAPLKDLRAELGACFKAELAANPDMPGQLVLAYTVTEQGRAANVEITNRELRGSAIQDCVKKALAAGRWPRFEGERKNVSVPFNIKKPPKPVAAPGAGQPG